MSVDKSTQINKARVLLSLHTQTALLVLPNVWNPIGAQDFAGEGVTRLLLQRVPQFRRVLVIGMAKNSRGRHSSILQAVLPAVSMSRLPRISKRVMAGTIADLAETINEVINSGVVGVNIEDSFEVEGVLRTIEEQCQRISVVRQVADRRGIPLVH